MSQERFGTALSARRSTWSRAQRLLGQCLQLRFDFDSTAIRPLYDNSTTIHHDRKPTTMWAAALRPK